MNDQVWLKKPCILQQAFILLRLTGLVFKAIICCLDTRAFMVSQQATEESNHRRLEHTRRGTVKNKIDSATLTVIFISMIIPSFKQNGETLLIFACRSNHKDVVKKLVAVPGLDVNIRCNVCTINDTVDL